MVSVVIPLYNAGQYITRCLDSAVKQSYRDVEIIVVDDASTDASLQIVEEYSRNHPGIRIIKHECNMGLMLTRKDGYKAAKGDFLIFLDADDSLPTDAITRLITKQNLTGADIVTGNLLKIYANGKKEQRKGCMNCDRCATRIETLSALIDECVIHSLCGKLYKTTLFRQGDLLAFKRLTIAEDACLLYQLVVKANCIASVDAFTYYYFENKASSSLRTYGLEQIENIVVAYKTMADTCAPYSLIHKKVERRLTKEVFSLYCERLPVRKVRELLAKHDMINYGSLGYACRYLSINDLWFFVKRFVYCRTMKR